MILVPGQEHNLKIRYFCSSSGRENLEGIGLGSAFTLDSARVLWVSSHSPIVEVGEMENCIARGFLEIFSAGEFDGIMMSIRGAYVYERRLVVRREGAMTGAVLRQVEKKF
jgi:hypothetical protein